LGPGSEDIGGPGALTYDEMRGWLRRARVYLYTGTQPASYTLGLIEAMMTGIPVVSIGPSWMDVFPYGPDLFEGHELVPERRAHDDPERAERTTTCSKTSTRHATLVRARAIELFARHDRRGRVPRGSVMTVLVLADRHHADLAESLLKLFEDRFGWEVYFPIGLEWADEGLWDYANGHSA
jgi:glycosyltransferase involved in cell wall biosynthesis